MRRLAALLPDTPRFLETRGMLLEGCCEILGSDEGGEGGPSFVARGLYPEEKLVSVVGRPPDEWVAEAVARNEGSGAVIAMPENAASVARTLPGWEMQTAVLHRLGEGGLLWTPRGDVRMLSGPEGLRALPSGLRAGLGAELEGVLGRGTPLAATFVGGVPVSFCYVASETEGLWDVSIDTLEGHRRRGYAASCAAFMVRHMRETRGKEPVWGALETNAASMNLAALLGFVPVDRYFVLEPSGG
ncbi:GNAT family N-acetyltransferase [Rubrobacter marinus]|uniref:GNAT family N-acetyltransferase n=1 Tax=Rubrobacter marinus TaxID=2653852 RepID=A0A6G8Q057_9ACTN|nr:GNAT family N-acetyltransferase [Rubrobacter marinus]QIN79859.1 GNAT family N-acetyltransferase [Rubrobacter marinus]